MRKWLWGGSGLVAIGLVAWFFISNDSQRAATETAPRGSTAVPAPQPPAGAREKTVTASAHGIDAAPAEPEAEQQHVDPPPATVAGVGPGKGRSDSPPALTDTKAPESAPTTATATKDPRFSVRWGNAGLCEAGDNRLDTQRQTLQSLLVNLTWPGITMLHASEVRPEILNEVKDSLELGRAAACSLVPCRTELKHPRVFLYKSLEQMRSVACVNTSAIGYYDGDMHLSGDSGHGLLHVRETVIHEYVHHVLLTSGVRLPMWLQEGLAIVAAGENWWKDPRLGLEKWLLGSHLPFDAMVPAFPHTADEQFALAAYYQSYMMVEFVRHSKGVTAVAEIVNALSRGTLDPKDAFTAGAGVEKSELEAKWAQFVQSRFSLAGSSPRYKVLPIP